MIDPAKLRRSDAVERDDHAMICGCLTGLLFFAVIFAVSILIAGIFP